MAKIVTVYSARRESLRLVDMSFIRWWKISETLAARGHQVDLATNEWGWLWKRAPTRVAENFRTVPLSKVKWSDYDVVKTLFHQGVEALERYGGASHPFVISKLGSVVGSRDMDGIYFYWRKREQLYAVQERIHARSRYVTVLTEAAKSLWLECFGDKGNVLIQPGAVDRHLAPPGRDPYPEGTGLRCIFSGNVYTRNVQAEANEVLIQKLNTLGELLARRGVRLYLLGNGDVRFLDRSAVDYLGVVPYEQSWDYLHHANVGVVVSAGARMHNNESTKIYHYLRAGLPVVSEAGFPNDGVVTEAGLGYVVENGNLEAMAERIHAAAGADWDRQRAIDYVLEHHTWDCRAEAYDALIRKALG